MSRLMGGVGISLLFLCLTSFGHDTKAHSAPEQAKAYYGGYTRTTRTFNLELVMAAQSLRSRSSKLAVGYSRV